MKTMKIKHLSKSEIKKLGLENITKKDKVELIEDEIKYLKVNGQILYFYYDDSLVPTLKGCLNENISTNLKKIIVDMGSIKFLTGGADLMRPGIVNIDEEINKDDLVLIVDENNNKPIMIGKALFDSIEMRAIEKGKVIKNIHHVGDKIWTSS